MKYILILLLFSVLIGCGTSSETRSRTQTTTYQPPVQTVKKIEQKQQIKRRAEELLRTIQSN